MSKAEDRLNVMIAALERFRAELRSAERSHDAAEMKRIRRAFHVQRRVVGSHQARAAALERRRGRPVTDDHGAIRALARECASESLAGLPPYDAILLCTVNPEFYQRLEQMLGRTYTGAERFAFYVAFMGMDSEPVERASEGVRDRS